MKKYIVGFIIGIVLMGAIGIVYAVSSDGIGFQATDERWNVTTVDEAINYLENN